MINNYASPIKPKAALSGLSNPLANSVPDGPPQLLNDNASQLSYGLRHLSLSLAKIHEKLFGGQGISGGVCPEETPAIPTILGNIGDSLSSLDDAHKIASSILGRL